MAGPGLDELAQADWSGGICRAVARHLIPGDAAYDIRDGLLDDDGDVYQRGPTTRITSNQVDTSLVALWEGQFSVGRRTIGMGTASIGVLGPGDTAWRTFAAGAVVAQAGLAAQLGEIMFLPTAAFIEMYAGSLKTAGYATGTASFTKGSKTVTGTGTAWTANVDAGMLIGVVGGGFYGVVASVDSNTQVTLRDGWQGATAAGATYNASPMQAYPLTPFTGDVYGPIAVVSGRVLWAVGHKVFLSQTIDQNTGQPQPFVHDADDYHEFPADVVALGVLRDVVYVFTKAGVWSISNAALPIVDAYGNPQHRVQKISGDVVLRSPGGIAPWRDSLIVCAVSGIYLMDSSGGLELISRSIAPLWQGLMSNQQVWQTAAFRDHVFVAVGGQLLVGRLDRRTKTPVGSSVPWTRFTQGEAAAVKGLAVQDPYGTPRLLGGAPGLPGSGFLVNLTGVFGSGALPAATGGLVDANGVAVSMIVETREYVPDAGSLATVRDVALEYESTDGTLVVSAAVGQRATPAADPTYTALTTTAAGNYASQNPRVIGVRREARRVSFQITSSGVSGWRLRAVRLRSRLRGRRR